MVAIWKTRQAVVKLTVIEPGIARVEQRNGRFSREQGLSHEVRTELGSDKAGYFEAEMVGDIWRIKGRLPDADRGW